jgi:Flp pilus assembly protein TadD
MSRLLGILQQGGHDEEAERLASETVAIDRRILGPEYPTTLSALEIEAVELSRLGRFGDAEKLFREAIQLAGKKNDPATLIGA